MRKLMIASLALLLGTFVAVRAADEQPKMPQPQKEHEWLKQLEGNWDLDIQVTEPNKETTRSKGTEITRMMGPFWAVSEVKASMMDMPFTGSLTLGYDAQAKKYVATWVDSMGDHLWKYEGMVEGGKTLTLETTGPCPMQGGKITRFKDVVQIQDKDHRTFESYVDFDGRFVQMMTIKYTRKAATAAAH